MTFNKSIASLPGKGKRLEVLSAPKSKDCYLGNDL